MYWFPQTKMGKISFWFALTAFVLFYLQYWIGMSLPDTGDAVRWEFVVPGFIALFGILAGGVCSVVALTKYKDRAIFLFVPALIGCLGLLFLLGEFLMPH